MRAGIDVVVVQGLRKRYSRRSEWVLGGVDLALGRGSGTVVVGSNGSGKSTLLRLIVRLARPTAGAVVGNPASVAYAPERLAGNIRMSSRLYLSHMGALRHLQPEAASERADALAQTFGLLPGLDAPIRSLSKGNSQKVALIQAFLAPVELLVLDEPYSGLDAGARSALSDLLATSIDAGAAVLLSSHTRIDVHPRSRNLLLQEGQLRDEVSSVAHRPLRLRVVPVGASTHADDLRSVPGILEVREGTSGEVNLTVAADRSDEILRVVLDRGWSVRALGEA